LGLQKKVLFAAKKGFGLTKEKGFISAFAAKKGFGVTKRKRVLFAHSRQKKGLK